MERLQEKLILLPVLALPWNDGLTLQDKNDCEDKCACVWLQEQVN